MKRHWLCGAGFYPGGAHFKTQRGRGGFLEDIVYDNIYGSGAAAAISFSCLHGAGPVTNATATPTLRNITVRNMHLTDVHGDGFGDRAVTSGLGSSRALSCACEYQHFCLELPSQEVAYVCQIIR